MIIINVIVHDLFLAFFFPHGFFSIKVHQTLKKDKENTINEIS